MKRQLTLAFLLSLILVSGTVLTLKSLSQPAQAQTDFRLRIPFDGNIWHKIKSYVDHLRRDGQRHFRFMNGDTYMGDMPYSYDDHRGTDFPLYEGTQILAADGYIVGMDRFTRTWGYSILVSHHNEQYFTRYSHLFTFTNQDPFSIFITETGRTLVTGSVVVAGEVIGYSGNTGNSSGPHLDLEVLNSDGLTLIDPFGWRGALGEDPLLYNGLDSPCLWDNKWCQETIVEDRDLPITGTAHYEENVGEPLREKVWFDTPGNQNNARYLFSSPLYAYARWKPTLPMKGRYEIFAFIPSANATTTQAIYKINTVNGIITATVNQSATTGWTQVTNTITSSFVLKCNSYVELRNDTGEINSSIGFDTMKFRYIGEGAPCITNNYLPIIRRDPTPTPTNTSVPTTTNTPIPTDTPTVEPTQTNTVEAFGSVQAPSSTPTRQPTQTATPTALHIPPTPGVTPIPTNTPMPTSTPRPSTNTPRPTSTSTVKPTSTPKPTNTPKPPTATNTPKPTSTPKPPPTLTSTPTKTPTVSGR